VGDRSSPDRHSAPCDAGEAAHGLRVHQQSEGCEDVQRQLEHDPVVPKQTPGCPATGPVWQSQREGQPPPQTPTSPAWRTRWKDNDTPGWPTASPEHFYTAASRTLEAGVGAEAAACSPRDWAEQEEPYRPLFDYALRLLAIGAGARARRRLRLRAVLPARRRHRRTGDRRRQAPGRGSRRSGCPTGSSRWATGSSCRTAPTRSTWSPGSTQFSTPPTRAKGEAPFSGPGELVCGARRGRGDGAAARDGRAARRRYWWRSK
jgi:hypothetical protein